MIDPNELEVSTRVTVAKFDGDADDLNAVPAEIVVVTEDGTMTVFKPEEE